MGLFEIDPPGWCFTHPQQPEKQCRHCGRPNVLRNGVIVCHTCDLVGAWPRGGMEP